MSSKKPFLFIALAVALLLLGTMAFVPTITWAGHMDGVGGFRIAIEGQGGSNSPTNYVQGEVEVPVTKQTQAQKTVPVLAGPCWLVMVGTAIVVLVVQERVAITTR